MKKITSLLALFSVLAVSAQDTWIGGTSADWNTAANWLDGTVAAGRPVLVSQHVFPAHRMRFAVELPVDDGLMQPSGMRLVDRPGV